MTKQPKECQIGQYWISKRPGREEPDSAWYRTWFDAAARQTRRRSLGTSDTKEAGKRLALWYQANGALRRNEPEQAYVEQILTFYAAQKEAKLAALRQRWAAVSPERASRLHGSKSLECNLALWREYFAGKTVADVQPLLDDFKDWLRCRSAERYQAELTEHLRREAAGLPTSLPQKEIGEAGIDRILVAGRAALNAAKRANKITWAPRITLLQSRNDQRHRRPMGRPLSAEEVARLLDATRSEHMFRYIWLGCTTLARPAAILDLGPEQYNTPNNLLDLNPPGRPQNNKFRPLIKVAPCLATLLALPVGPSGRYVHYLDRPIGKITHAWRMTRARAGLDKRVNPYSLRHTMARAMRAAGVPPLQVSLVLGHEYSGEGHWENITEIYAPYDPNYLREAVGAIEAFMAEVRSHMGNPAWTWDERPAAPDAVQPADRNRRPPYLGVGEDRRELVRRLLREGRPHKEVVRLSGVSTGTVCVIRKALRAAGARLFLATDHRVTPALHEAKPVDETGGPGRTRTCDNTVMSGAF